MKRIYREHTNTFSILKEQLSELTGRLERVLLLPAPSSSSTATSNASKAPKFSGDIIARNLQTLTEEHLEQDDISGIMTTLIQSNYLVPSKGTSTLLQSGTVPPTSRNVRYRLNRGGDFAKSNKFLSPSPRSTSTSTSNRPSIAKDEPQASTTSTQQVSVVPETLNSELPPTSLSASRGGVSILSIITFYIAASVLLWWTRENAMMHSVGLVVLGVIILWVSLLPTMHSTVQSPKKSPVQHRRRGDPQIVRSLPSTPSSPSTSSTSTTHTANGLRRGVPIPSKAPYLYYGPYQSEFQTCVAVLEDSLRVDYADWKCTTSEISGIDKYHGAFGTVHRMNPVGHKYSKFKLELFIPQQMGEIKDVIRCCKEERLQWDVAMNKAEELKTESHGELRTMLYTTKRQFGISPRVFVEREWSIQFPNGSQYSFSNSIPFDEPFGKNAVEQLSTPHTRGINHPGSAWIFERVENKGTKMIQLIHSDLKGWMYPGVVNMSLNTHLGNFSRVLLQYIENQQLKNNLE